MTNPLNKKLGSVRLARIDAEMGPGANGSGGSLDVDVKLALSEIVDGKNTATVSVSAKGIPKGADESGFAFRISITGAAIWEWMGDIPSKDALEQDSMLYELCTPIYTLIVSEVSRVALGLGFPGVSLSWSLGEGSEPKPQKKKTTAASRPKRTTRSTSKA